MLSLFESELFDNTFFKSIQPFLAFDFEIIKNVSPKYKAKYKQGRQITTILCISDWYD